MTLQKLLLEITQGSLIPADMFVREDLDDILDQRDVEEFAQPWMECSRRIEAAWEAKPPADAAKKMISEIRKESFLLVSRATDQHEMASYVSDDFELISKSLALDLHDPYANGLLDTYRRGEIPR